MKKKCSLLCLITVLLVAFSGCGKVKKEFDFSQVTDVKVVSSSHANDIIVRDSKRAKKIANHIADVKWIRDDASKNIATEQGNWSYRVVCYDSKGEILQTMTFLSGNKMFYKDYYYDAEDEKGIDFTELKKLFEE